MSRRLEIELTSERPDGTWTWRAAGAKQPKGELRADLLPQGAKVGDVVRADADFLVDGIEILSVLPPKAPRKEPDRLVVVGTRNDGPLVTTQLAPKGRGRDGDRRGRRRERGEGEGRDERRSRPRGEGRPRGPRPDPVPERPKPKRLRPGRRHRSAVLDELPIEHRPIAEQVLRGGVPAVREAISKQNEQAKKENRPEIPADQLVALAEQLLPRLRAAEWRDRADAAIADLDQLDLRDLRSVVVAADSAARDEESRALQEQLQSGLTRRVEEEQDLWISDISANLDAGRFVRALRLSSRPPKAGAPLPPELATRLILAVSEGLTPTVNQDLWAAAVDALAYSPVRTQVTPAGRPAEPSEALLDAVKRVGDRLPAIVELFGLDPAEVAAAAKRRPRTRGKARAGKAPQQKADQGKGQKKPEQAEKQAAEQAKQTEAEQPKAEPAEHTEVAGVSSPEEATLPSGESVPPNEQVEVPVEGEGQDAAQSVSVPAEAQRALEAEPAEAEAEPAEAEAEPAEAEVEPAGAEVEPAGAEVEPAEAPSEPAADESGEGSGVEVE